MRDFGEGDCLKEKCAKSYTVYNLDIAGVPSTSSRSTEASRQGTPFTIPVFVMNPKTINRVANSKVGGLAWLLEQGVRV